MINILVKSLSFFLTIYFASLIIFKDHYFYITHIVDILLLANFIFLFFIKKEKIFEINSIIYIYTVFTIVALASSLWGVEFEGPSFKSLQLLLVLINIVIIYNSMKTFNVEYTFLHGILFGAFINYLILLGILPVPYETYIFGRAVGTLGNANTLAITMILSIFCSIIFLRKGKEIKKVFFYYQYINIFLAMYLIFLTASKKGIIFGLIFIVTYLLLSMKRPKNMLRLGIFGLVGIAMIINFVTVDNLVKSYEKVEHRFHKFESQITGNQQARFSSTGERKYFIALGLDLFSEKPLIGHGLDNFREFSHTYSHNNFIELLVGVGLIGTIIYYLIYFYLFKMIFEMKDNNLKVIFSSFVLILFLMDIARVSYDSKMLLYTLLFISVFIERNRQSHFNSLSKTNEQ